MFLTAHALAGAASGRLGQNPSEAFVFGFASHFLLDALPHWNYPLTSLVYDKKNPLDKDMVLDRRFLRDLIFIGADFFIGIILAVFIFGDSPSVMLGILGGVLPDALQFIYCKFRHQPFIAFQKLHNWFHAKEEISALPYGILIQITVTGAAILLSKFIAA